MLLRKYIYNFILFVFVFFISFNYPEVKKIIKRDFKDNKYNYSNLYVTEDLKSKFLPLHPKLKRYYNTHFLKNGTNLKDYLT